MAQPRTTLDPAEAILAALAQLGQATAADIATAAGVAYSTTTRNLRELAAAGRVEKVADGKQSQWRLPTTASPHAGTQASAELGTKTGTEAGTAAGIPAANPSSLDSSPDAASPDDAGADAATLPDTTITDAADRSIDTAAPADSTDHAGDNAETGDSDAHATTPDNDQDNDASHGDPDNGDRDNGTADDDRLPQVRVEDRVQADRRDDDVADDAATETDTHGAGPNGADAPGGANAGGVPAATPPVQAGAAAKPRRASGTFDGAVLDVLEAHPDRAFKVSELCKLIDAANAGQDVSKASPGAVVLACQRLVTKGKAVLAVEKPVSFQLVAADTTAPSTPA
jgi:hypothetical protein